MIATLIFFMKVKNENSIKCKPMFDISNITESAYPGDSSLDASHFALEISMVDSKGFINI